MRALFTCVPGVGHLLPILPLAHAAAAAGVEVTVSTHHGLGRLVTNLPFVAAGPPADELMSENVRRHQGLDAGAVEMVADLFTATRVELTYETALAVAERVRPNLIVADATDFVAPLVASRLEIPWVAHAVTTPPPLPLARGFADRLAERHRERNLTPSARLGLVDVWPDWLTPGDVVAPSDRWPMSPGAEPRTDTGSEAGHQSILVTLGTVVEDDGLVTTAVNAVLDLGLNAVVTVDPGAAMAATWPADRVIAVGFVALAELLPGVDAVITAGGAGTVLAALRHGRPMVLTPRRADQPVVSERVEAFGAGIVCERDDPVSAALARVREEPGHRAAARLAADRMERLDPAPRVWSRIASALTGSRATAVSGLAGPGAG